MLRRVRKEEFDSAPVFNRQDGLFVCLDCWKQYMLQDDRDLSVSRMQLRRGDKMTDPAGYESDPYYEQHKEDLRIGEATNTMINDLKACWRWAIYRKCSITTVWNFPSVDFLACLEDAQAALESKLRVDITTATQFI